MTLIGFLEQFEHRFRCAEGIEQCPIRERVDRIVGTVQRSPARCVKQIPPLVEKRIGKDELDRTLLAFTDHFPPVEVYRRGGDSKTWLKGSTAGKRHSRLAMEELLLLWLANQNPAFSPYLELFDDQALEKRTAELRTTVEELTDAKDEIARLRRQVSALETRLATTEKNSERIDALTPWSGNARTHSRKQLRQIAASIEKYQLGSRIA